MKSLLVLVVLILMQLPLIIGCVPPSFVYEISNNSFAPSFEQKREYTKAYTIRYDKIDVTVSNYLLGGYINHIYIVIKNKSLDTIEYKVNQCIALDKLGEFCFVSVYANGARRKSNYICNIPSQSQSEVEFLIANRYERGYPESWLDVYFGNVKFLEANKFIEIDTVKFRNLSPLDR